MDGVAGLGVGLGGHEDKALTGAEPVRDEHTPLQAVDHHRRRHPSLRPGRHAHFRGTKLDPEGLAAAGTRAAGAAAAAGGVARGLVSYWNFDDFAKEKRRRIKMPLDAVINW